MLHTAASLAPRRALSFSALTVNSSRPISSTPNSSTKNSRPTIANSTV